MTTPTLEQTYDMRAIASRVMYELLGRRWVWPRMHAIDAYPARTEIILTGRPVSEIIQVTSPNGVILDPADYELYSKFRLRLPYWATSKSSCYGPQPEVLVEYIYGTPAPAQIQYAIEVLANQLELAAAGSTECKLPKRITSIARQGINMTILDPQDFLEKGMTGLPEVDFAISVFNRGRAKARSRVFTADNPPARRLSVVPVDEETLLYIKQGSDWVATWPVFDENNDLEDVTTWTAQAQVRDDDDVLLYEWASNLANVEMGNGFVRLKVPAGVSSLWDWRRGRFDLEITSPALEVTRIDEGQIIVDPEVTT